MPSEFVYLATIEWQDETVVVGAYANVDDAQRAFGHGGTWRTDHQTYWWRHSSRPVEDIQCIDRLRLGELCVNYALNPTQRGRF